MPTPRLFRDGGWALAGKASNLALVVLGNVLITRLLPTDVVGVYFLIFSVTTTLAVVAQAGLGQVAVRTIAEAISERARLQVRGTVGSLVIAAMVSSIVVASLVSAGPGRWLLTAISPYNAEATAKLVAVWIACAAIQGLQGEIFRGFRDIRGATLFGGLNSSALFVGTLAFFASASVSVPLEAVIVSAICGCLASVLWGLRPLYRKLQDFPRGALVNPKHLIRVAWPILIANLTTLVATQVDLWVVASSKVAEDVAIYGAASRAAALISVPLIIANSLVPPIIAQYSAQHRKTELETLLRGVASLAAIPSLALFATFVVFGNSTLSALFGPQYADGTYVLALLSIGNLINVLTGSCGFTLLMTGHERPMMTITVACTFATAILAVLGMKWFGPVGVAAVAMMGVATQNALMLLAARRLSGIWTHVAISRMPRLSWLARH